MNHVLKPLLVALLGGSALGFARQASAPSSASPLESLVATAQQAQAAGDYGAAAESYRKAVALSPGTAELWANLGLMQQETRDFTGATKSFLQANRLNPGLYVSNLFLGIDYAHSGQPMKAIPYLIKAEKINKTDPQAPLALGRAYVSAGKFTMAAQALDRATALDPKLAVAWFTLGIARLDQLEADARTMSEQDPQSPFAGALYAESLARQARFGEAISQYKSLLDALPQPPCLRSEMGFAMIREHDQSGAAAAFAAERNLHPGCGLALLGQARLAIDSGDADRAVSLLSELWNRDRGFLAANAFTLLEGLSPEKTSAAVDLLTTGDSAALSADLRAALLNAFSQSDQISAGSVVSQNAAAPPVPAPPAVLRRTAEEEYSAGHFDQCKLQLEAGAASPSATKLRQLTACAYFAGDFDRASSSATALRALDARSPEAFYWSIRANERLAFQALARFQQLDSSSARSHVLLADIYQQLERFDDAQAECLKALAIAPGDPAALLGLASAYLSNHNPSGAIEIAQQALARTPDDPELNLIVAEALMNQSEYAASEPYLLKSLHAKPQIVPRVHALLGKAYSETGRNQEAIEQLKLGASSDVDGSVQYLLARLYRQFGDLNDASAAISRMKAIKEQREARGVKRIEDRDLSPVESQASAP